MVPFLRRCLASVLVALLIIPADAVPLPHESPSCAQNIQANTQALASIPLLFRRYLSKRIPHPAKLLPPKLSEPAYANVLKKLIEEAVQAALKKKKDSARMDISWTEEPSGVIIKIKEDDEPGTIVRWSHTMEMDRRYSTQTWLTVLGAAGVVFFWSLSPSSPFTWAASWMGMAVILGRHLLKVIPSTAAGRNGSIARRAETTAAALVILFVLGIYADYHFMGDLVERNPAYEMVSFMVLGFAGAVTGGLLAQWRRIRAGKQTAFDLRDMLELIALNVFYSAMLVEGFVYGVLLPLLPGGGFGQVFFDFLILSPLFTEPAAFFVYSRYLQNKPENEAMEEIRKDLLSFYIGIGWIWSLFILAAMIVQPFSSILSFGFVSMGVLMWNVAFEAENWPTLEERLGKMRGRRFIKYAVPWLQRVQKYYAHPSLGAFLRHIIFAVALMSIAHQMALMRAGPFAIGMFLMTALAVRILTLRTSRTIPLRSA